MSFSWDFLTFSWYHQNITKAYSLVSIGYSIVVFSTKFIQILFSKYLQLSLSTYLQFDSAHHDLSMTITWILLWSNKVWSEKKFTHICMYYTNSARVCVKSLRSAKSRHSKDSKLVRQVHIIEKILSETMSEQKNFFCENAIFVKNYWHKKSSLWYVSTM